MILEDGVDCEYSVLPDERMSVFLLVRLHSHGLLGGASLQDMT